MNRQAKANQGKPRPQSYSQDAQAVVTWSSVLDGFVSLKNTHISTLNNVHFQSMLIFFRTVSLIETELLFVNLKSNPHIKL